MVAQADEIDSKYLHFENDLETTSTFLSAVFDLSEATNKKPLITSVSCQSTKTYFTKTFFLGSNCSTHKFCSKNKRIHSKCQRCCYDLKDC